MTHLIIYDNREGYRFYEASHNFPGQYKREIEEICRTLTCGSVCKPALRYTPLRDRFLLSVIFRCPEGSTFQKRGLYIVVNFLMEADDADHLFSHPFSAVHDAVIQYAASLYTQYADTDEFLPTGLQMERWQLFTEETSRSLPLPFYQKFSHLTHIDLEKWKSEKKSPYYPQPMDSKNVVMPRSWLLSSVLYHNYAVPHQVYVGLHTRPSWEIQWLQESLPVKLRKDMTFHTDVISDCESHGITLNFSDVESLHTMQTKGFQGGPATTKHTFFSAGSFAKAEKDASPTEQQFHPKSEKISQVISQIPFGIYQIIAKSIHTWDAFLKLAELNDTEEILPQIFQIIPKERLLDKKNDTALTNQEKDAWERALRATDRRPWGWDDTPVSSPYTHHQDTDPYPVPPESNHTEREQQKNSTARHTGRCGVLPLVCSFLAILTGSIGLLLVLLGRYSVTSQSFPEKLVIEISAVATASLLETLVTILCTVFLTLGISRLTQSLRNK